MKFANLLVTLNEGSVKLEAIKNLKNIQAQLTTINFLDVLSVMNNDNPLKKDVESFEGILTDLRVKMEEFINANQYDATDPEDNPDLAVKAPAKEEVPAKEPKEKKDSSKAKEK
jgi:hypothetical protein